MARRPKPWFRKARQAWFVTINGVQHNLGPDKAEAYDLFYQLMRQPHPKKVSPHSLVAIIDEFLDWVQRHRSPESYEGYHYRLQRFAEHYPDLSPAHLRPHHVEKWADQYDIKQTTRRNDLRAVKRCMKWANQQGYIDTNPIENLEVPAAESKEVVIKPDEFGQLVSLIRDRSLHDLIVTAWEIGCRPQEILRVEARHVDAVNQRWVFSKSEAKMKRISRVIYLSDKAAAITRRLALKYPEGPLFRNSRGAPWTTMAVNCAFIRLQHRMGIEEMERRGEEITDEQVTSQLAHLKRTKMVQGTPVNKSPAELKSEAKQKLRYKRATELAPKYSLYALRHSWATNALERGLDPLTVAILMGHKDPSMLAKVYQHLSFNPAHLLEQVRRATA